MVFYMLTMSPAAVAGLSQLVFCPIFLNAEAVILAKFEMRSMLEAVVKYKINEMWLVPRESWMMPEKAHLTKALHSYRTSTCE